VLTLILTPCALMMRANIALWRATRRARRDAKAAAAMAPSPTPLLTHAANTSQPKAAE
jgi:hypothetical protein